MKGDLPMKQKKIEKVAGKVGIELSEEESEVKFHKNRIDDILDDYKIFFHPNFRVDTRSRHILYQMEGIFPNLEWLFLLTGTNKLLQDHICFLWNLNQNFFGWIFARDNPKQLNAFLKKHPKMIDK